VSAKSGLDHILAEPLSYIIGIWALSLLLLVFKRHRAAGIFSSFGLFAIVISGVETLPHAIVRSLENEFPHDLVEIASHDGVIILGGVLPNGDGDAWQRIEMNENAERIVATALVVRSLPQLSVVFTGGSASSDLQNEIEADRAKRLLVALGVSAERMMFERAARTTEQNAQFTAKLLGERTAQRWILATSAWHMPRAMQAFAAAGWKNVSAMPVDFRAANSVHWSSYSMRRSHMLWRIALHEYIGIVWYRAKDALRASAQRS
jgi:uncharacterized SAM-binding protein YcdF (DUF218 family)